MELIRGLHNLRPRHRGCVVTIGNFDGMHLGHQALLAEVREGARRLEVAQAVVLFEPQPREYFEGEEAPARLMRLREKLRELARSGVERLLCLRFDGALASMPPEAFVRRILVEGLGACAVVVGDDFRFGRERGGDLGLLRRLGERSGFEVRQIPPFTLAGERVSSSLVREALASGQMERARCLLGRWYGMEGTVVHGAKRGRRLGFPTINIDLHRRRSPIAGVFAARVHGLEEEPLPGMAYVGSRPVVGGTKPLLEVHLFDFDRECYGAHVTVEFVHKLREDLPFASLDRLRLQLREDEVGARRALAEVENDG